MIKSVTATNFKGERLTLELAHPEKSGLIVINVDGIGGADGSINTSDLAGGDGALFNSARLNMRDIILTLRPMLDPSVEENRHKLYHYFPVKKPIELQFDTTIRTSVIKGYTEKIETGIFSKDEELTITVVCPDPYFYGTEVQDVAFEGVHPKFMFPFSNPVGEKTLLFSEIRTDTRATLEYNGDADAGITIKLYFNGEVRGIVIYSIEANEHFTINDSRLSKLIGGVVQQGDEIEISTIRQNRTVRHYRSGKWTNILGAVDRDSSWFQLTTGYNAFEFTTTYGRDNLRMIVSYVDNYGGV